MEKTLKDLTGITAFLNGQEGQHDMEGKLFLRMLKLGKKAKLIDNLFEQPEKLAQVIGCDNLVLSTTGLYADKLKMLVAAFEKMNYVPKVVIFMGENTAMAFLGTARDLKKKHGTEFYFPDIFDDSLFEISWI